MIDTRKDQLLNRQQLGKNFDNEESAGQTSAVTSIEPDAAWRAFAESIKAWITPSTGKPPPDDRLLPLPQALEQALTQDRWEAGVLAAYDASVQREFPLETRLWGYLRTLHTDTPAPERKRALQAVDAWIDDEARAPSQDSPSWLPYLRQHRAALDAADDAASAGAEAWLQDLLQRHQPLPAPLYA